MYTYGCVYVCVGALIYNILVPAFSFRLTRQGIVIAVKSGATAKADDN